MSLMPLIKDRVDTELYTLQPYSEDMLLRFNPFTLIHEKIIREDRYIEFIIINITNLAFCWIHRDLF